MDQWNRNVLHNRIEQWREQRVKKMAARLQLNSTKPRTISSNVLGYVNYRQPMTVQPGYRQQHGEGPRFNHGDQRWNSNYNYSGYRENHSPRTQYHPADPRNHGYGQGSYHHHHHHQQNGQKKGGHFSSHKSLYNDRKPITKTNKRYSSSCNNLSNTAEVGNQSAVCPPEQPSCIVSEKTASSNSENNSLQVNPGSTQHVTPVPEELTFEGEIEKSNDSEVRIQENPISESERLQCDAVNEAVEIPEVANCEVNDDHLPNELLNHVEIFVSSEADVIGEISVLGPNACSSDEALTLFVDESSTIAINKENSAITVDVELTEVDHKEKLSQNTTVKLDCVSVETVSENSTIAYECNDINNAEIETNVEEKSVIEQITPSEASCDVTNETLNLELNLSFKPDIEMVENADEEVDPLQLSEDVGVDSSPNKHSNNEGNEESCAGKSCNENAVFPVALIIAGDSNTEASIIRFDDTFSESENDISKEIEHVENKMAKISIVNTEDATNDEDCITPMKRERRQVLLDATNILPTSTIKFSVREVRKNDESEIIVTPVRRSARLSTLTPVSTHKNVCVQKLEELTPEVIQKMKFVKNPAIEDLP